MIDTISRAVEGEENSNDTWLDFYRYTGLSLKRAAVAMARLDHTGKDEAKGQRGGSAKYGDVDAVWRLTRITEDRFHLECTDTRFPLDHKLLKLIRRTDPLRHVVENLSAITQREAKILQTIKEADEAGLSPDAPRADVQRIAKARGIKARNDIYAEVVKRRKLSPNPWDTHAAAGSPEVPDEAGDSSEQHGDSGSDSVPDPWGQTGTEHIGPSVPVPTTIGGDSGTTGQGKPSYPPCSDCGQPLA